MERSFLSSYQASHVATTPGERGEMVYGILIHMSIILERSVSITASDGRSTRSGRLRGHIDSLQVYKARAMGTETKIPLTQRRKITGAERYLRQDTGHLDKPQPKS